MSKKKETIKLLTIKEVEKFACKKRDGMKSLYRRRKIFKRDNYTCMKCGVRGCYWALEMYKDGRIELQLYAINTDGKEVLMTIDHIKPVSKGGTDGLKNHQSMCHTCNNKKGNEYSENNIDSGYA